MLSTRILPSAPAGSWHGCVLYPPSPQALQVPSFLHAGNQEVPHSQHMAAVSYTLHNTIHLANQPDGITSHRCPPVPRRHHPHLHNQVHHQEQSHPETPRNPQPTIASWYGRSEGTNCARTKGGCASYEGALIKGHHYPRNKGGHGTRYEGAALNGQQQCSTRNALPYATHPPMPHTE
jgi:hypothetical protein